MDGKVIELKGVERRFGDRDALHGIDLTLGEGQTLAVLGPNGAGKTTLLRLLCGLLRPHGGELTVLGARLPGESWAIRGRVGVVLHDPMLYASLSARENLHHQARLQRQPPERADALLGAVGISGRADEPLRNLSRGMIQRASVARALLSDPPLLLLDEPFANLDPRGAELLDGLLAGGRTRVITGHEPRSLLEGADLAIGLRAGRAEFVLPAADVDEEQLGRLYR